MHFYVDETGHTGPNLFDPTQPVLSYGVLSSRMTWTRLPKLSLLFCVKNWGHSACTRQNWACTALMRWSIRC